MNRDKLIQEVRKHPCLYDARDSKYTDPNKKHEAWSKISGALSQPRSQCKKVWLNLREAHRRSIKKKRRSGGQVGNNIKKWTYEEEMSFLLPHYKQRSTTSISDEDADIYDTVLNDEDSESSINTPELDTFSCPTFSAFTVDPTNTKPVTLEKNEDKGLDTDEIDRFFSSIAATVKKFSPYHQAVIKSQVFTLVSQVEMQELIEKPNFTTQATTAISSEHKLLMWSDECDDHSLTSSRDRVESEPSIRGQCDDASKFSFHDDDDAVSAAFCKKEK